MNDYSTVSEDEHALFMEHAKRFGGSFAKALAEAYRVADPHNRRKIRQTWPELWSKYTYWFSSTT